MLLLSPKKDWVTICSLAELHACYLYFHDVHNVQCLAITEYLFQLRQPESRNPANAIREVKTPDHIEVPYRVILLNLAGNIVAKA